MVLSEDRPIDSFDEDRLGYSVFCRSVAKALVRDYSSGSLVVGLHASWGMGKTSAVNLIKKAIEELDADADHNQKTIVIDFDPWMFTGRDDLVKRFFEQVSLNLPKELGKKVRKYGDSLRRKVNRYGEPIGRAADLAGWTWGGGHVLGTIARRFTVSGEKSNNLVRSELITELIQARRRIVVVIDDIDRLHPEEIREMLVLLRSTGDLPGIIYLVVCDRRIVEQGLCKAGIEERVGSDEPRFLEKIIQVDLNVPPPLRRGLDEIFEQGVESIMGDAIGLNSKRMSRLYQEGLRHFLDSPRRVVRLLNALRVSWPAVAHEVNGVDFILLETLRVFERKVYQAIKRSRDDLVGWSIRMEEERETWRKDFLEELSGTERKDPRRVLLLALFPRLQDRNIWPEDGERERLDRHVSNDEFWEAYFRLEPSGDLGSARYGRDVIAKLDDQEAVESAIDAMLEKRDSKGRSLAGALLDDIYSHVQAKHRGSAPLLKALIAKAEPLIAAEDKRGRFSDAQVDNHRALESIFENSLEALPEEDQQSVLRELYGNRNAVCFLAQRWWRLAHLAGVIDTEIAGQGNGPVVDKDLINEISLEVKEALEGIAEDGSLKQGTHLAWTLRIWQHLSGDETVSSWLDSALDDPKFTARLSDHLMATSFSSLGEQRFLSMGNEKSPFTDKVYTAAKEIECRLLSPSEINIVETFIASYEAGGEHV